ncbi:MAG: hypothetical protein QOG46_2932, partial [Pseudonocardiales bacterium]|nr:hypothetical protein [Pseudonocardiales bacterium]
MTPVDFEGARDETAGSVPLAERFRR